MCHSKECDYYPQFGVAPHICYWQKAGGFDNPLGTSDIKPLDEWPANFRAEIDVSKPIKEQLSWGLCGVYFCPECLGEIEQYGGLWSKDRVLGAISEVETES